MALVPTIIRAYSITSNICAMPSCDLAQQLADRRDAVLPEASARRSPTP